MLEYGSFSFLFTGDISNKTESKLVSSGVDLSCDVLKVAHHGSKSSSSPEFLKATGAKYSVICVGQNSYGHPTSSALNNLASAGMVIYRTDKDGNVEFSTNGSEMTLPKNDGIVAASEYSSRNIKPEIEAQIYTIRKLKYSFCLLNSISCHF
jgi:beta-lactamase superfamily II metal-dependent hydrolase